MFDIQRSPGPPDGAQRPSSGNGKPGRVWFRTDTLPKKIAKTLKRRARQRGIDLNHRRALDIVARMNGYRHWPDLRANIGERSGHTRLGLSRLDEDEIAASQQATLISSLNISPADGAELYRAIVYDARRAMRPVRVDPGLEGNGGEVRA